MARVVGRLECPIRTTASIRSTVQRGKKTVGLVAVECSEGSVLPLQFTTRRGMPKGDDWNRP